MKRIACASSVAMLLLIGVPAPAQRVALARSRIRIVVTDELQKPLKDVNVELQDSVGFASAGTSQITQSDGRAEFDSLVGLHRIRIYGSEIEDYEGEFEVAPNESSHTENIRVKRKPPVGGIRSVPGPPVPKVRLNIPGAAQKEYDRGAKAVEKRDWNAAADAFRAAVNVYPDYDLAYNALGIALNSLGDNAGAKEAFQKALSISPEYAGAARNLARILIGERDWKQADELLRKSLQNEPQNAWALTNAAYIELQLHNFNDAVSNAQKVHALPHAEYANAHYIAAIALEELKHNEDARVEFETYLKEAPTGPNAARAKQAVTRLSVSPK